MRVRGAAGGPARRRRRTPEAAQREIIAAAESLLRERPFRELTVDEVMRRTGLSRPSFYVYFKDRHDLVLRVVQHLLAEMMAATRIWLDGLGPEELRRSLVAAVEAYRDHAPVFRAVADAAVDDPTVERAWGDLLQTIIDAVASHLREEVDSGRMPPLDTDEMATALVWMGERYLYLSFAPGAGQVDTDRLIATMHTIFVRTLYPGS